jgi:UDP-glucose 4-epimerase
VGRALCKELAQRGYGVRAAVRDLSRFVNGHCDRVKVNDIGPATDWSVALSQVDTVVHLAARVHVMRDQATNPLAEFRCLNVDGTLNLARQAVAAGVRRFVFLSSIGVNGRATRFGQKITADDLPVPHDPYSISKYEAEQGLRQLADETGLEVVIIRPPLVYGAHAPGNFGRLINVLVKRFPLPLGAIHNKRSFVALDNLVDLIVTCLDHPAAVNQTFLVADGEDLSTTELLRRMGASLGSPARLIPVPTSLLEAGSALLGKRDAAQRLCGSLQVDISKTRELLGWNPPISVDEGLRRTAQGLNEEVV